MSEKKIRLTMGFAFLVMASFMFARNIEWIQGGGTAIGLSGGKLVIAVLVNFIKEGAVLMHWAIKNIVKSLFTSILFNLIQQNKCLPIGCKSNDAFRQVDSKYS